MRVAKVGVVLLLLSGISVGGTDFLTEGVGSGIALTPGWISHDLPAPATPVIVNGVVFALATGVPSTPTGRGTPAVLHAYHGETGKRLWNSENAMSIFASPGSLWCGLGQIYVGTHDGTLYAFGFNDERRHVVSGFSRTQSGFRRTATGGR